MNVKISGGNFYINNKILSAKNLTKSELIILGELFHQIKNNKELKHIIK